MKIFLHFGCSLVMVKSHLGLTGHIQSVGGPSIKRASGSEDVKSLGVRLTSHGSPRRQPILHVF